MQHPFDASRPTLRLGWLVHWVGIGLVCAALLPLGGWAQQGAVELAQEGAERQGEEQPPLPVQKESITVVGKRVPVEEGAATPTSVGRDEITAQALKPSTVREALPLIPGVTRTPEGRLNILAAPEQRSALLVNSMDVTDPATGDFGATVPIDSIAQMSIYRSPFLAEYGRFTAGVVAVDTRRGGDKWTYELNDPTPEFRIRSARLVGIRAFTPRFTTTGPLVRNKLYMSQSVEFLLKKIPVFTLQFPSNEERRQSWNSLTQLDYIPSARHLFSFTLHGVPQRINFARLDFYNPRPVTPHYRGHEFRGGVVHSYHSSAGLLDSAFSVDRTEALIGAYGEEEFVMTPTRHFGNYFMRQNRESNRWQWRETWSPRAGNGTHRFKLGGALRRTELNGFWRANPIRIETLAGEPLSRIDFQNRPEYRLSDWEGSLFVQDRWVPVTQFVLDAGLRTDYQKMTGVWRMAPRFGAAFSPFANGGTVLRGGFGWFFDRVPLNIYAFPHYPAREVTTYAQGGETSRVLFRNVLDAESGQRAPLVFGSSRPGNFAPRSANWNVEWEHQFSKLVMIRTGYLQTWGEGQVVLQPGAQGGVPALLLQGKGRSRQRHFETVARISWQEEQQLMFSYVRSWARSNLNDFSNFLGNFPIPVVRPDVYTEASGNIPHRVLAWGVIPFKAGWRVAPMAEWRSGFPYAALNPLQEYAGIPNTRRFPQFLAVDFRVSKDIQYRGHGFRVSFSMFNLLNRNNPDTVRLNTGDGQFRQFLGIHPRRYRLDFDYLF